MAPFRYHLSRLLFLGIVKPLGSYEVFGRENIPTERPYMAVTNHMSLADTPLLLIAFPPTKIRFFAGEKWRTHPIFGPFMGWLGAIYINRGAVDRKALKEGIMALEDGDVFGLAPEGTRSKIGQLNRGRDGAAYLASRTKTPILPVGLTGTNLLSGNVRRMRRTPLQVNIGRPFNLPDLGRRPRSRDYSAYTHLIMVHIAALLPPHYWGYYADSPALSALLAGDDPWPHAQAAELKRNGRQSND